MFDDELVKAIKCRFASDFASALDFRQEVNSDFEYTDHIKLPLTGTVRVAYDKGIGNFIVRSSFYNPIAPERAILSEQCFSSRPVVSAHDAAALIETMFDDLKKVLLRKLAEGYLSEILEPKEG